MSPGIINAILSGTLPTLTTYYETTFLGGSIADVIVSDAGAKSVFRPSSNCLNSIL